MKVVHIITLIKCTSSLDKVFDACPRILGHKLNGLSAAQTGSRYEGVFHVGLP